MIDVRLHSTTAKEDNMFKGRYDNIFKKRLQQKSYKLWIRLAHADIYHEDPISLQTLAFGGL